ncbi:MAG TPA: GNAT family N-acetyltransferase, partial [Actinomycetota bacterium]|nr:GNAT family N-acetyltransferase [Actinomycetota bacterium]
MPERIIDVDLESFPLLPKPCMTSVYWELAQDVDQADAPFHKEEWFSSTLLEWGPCGKLVVEEGTAVAFAQYAPSTLFPRLRDFAAASEASPDAVYLSYCYVVDEHRGQGLGSRLIREVARDAVDRGYRAVEAVGDRAWEGGWVLPLPFLTANGFLIVRDDPRFPLLRLDLHERPRPAAVEAEAAVPAPSI